jgi:hypothetical protein
MARLFTGDFSSGDFRKWAAVVNKHIPEGSPGNRSAWNNGEAFPPNRFYAAQVISDGDVGHVARFELRQGDIPWWGGGERSEVADDGPAALALIGTTRWYALSFKLDETFPANHTDLGWGMWTQWKSRSGAPDSVGDPAYSPILSFGFPYKTSVAGNLPGTAAWDFSKFALQWVQYGAPPSPGVTPTSTHIIPVAQYDPKPGQWHDFTMQVKWEQDQTGFVKLWYNGEPQTLYGGADILYGPTVAPDLGGSNPQHDMVGTYFHQGYYRQAGIPATGIIYHTGLRMADTEDSL